MKPKPLTFRDFDKKLNKKKTGSSNTVIYFIAGIFGLHIGLAISSFIYKPEAAMIEIVKPSPSIVPSASPTVIPATESAKFLPRAQKVDDQPRHLGLASYYSRSGCVGCSPTMTMANGQPLDDSKLTVAFNRAKLGSKVKVVNSKTGESVIAIVTDTGGFEKHGRIIDLTIATRDAIKCTNLCKVEVEVL